ncbi:MAG: hypothetical protein BWY72_01401 [Bacteroidetes bacterium ADurb.Bin416]|nr:MAG: hypothetical protein BWY72_01401 [Bacteroidetes bacterium ADurb.Bin416]
MIGFSPIMSIFFVSLHRLYYYIVKFRQTTAGRMLHLSAFCVPT